MAPRRAFGRMPLVGFAALLAHAGCGSAPPPVVPVPAPRAARAAGSETGFPVYSMRLIGTGGTGGPLAWVHLELDEDGTLRWRAARVGRLTGTRIEDELGRTLVAVARDGVVTLAEQSSHDVLLRDDGALEIDGNTERIYFDEKGHVVTARFGQPPRFLALRMHGLRPDAARTGALLVLFALVQTHQL